MHYRAVYLDKDGCAHSSPVELHGDTWKMLTNEGWQPTKLKRSMKQRAQQRREMLDALNQPDTREIAEARAINTLLVS